jgi:hypothetical protein
MPNGVFPTMLLGSRATPPKRNSQPEAQLRAIYDLALENKALGREPSGLLSDAVLVDLVGVIEIEQFALTL